MDDKNPKTPNSDPAAGATSSAEQLEAVRAERDENLQKYLLAVADLENYRKRVQKELEQERRYRVLPLAHDLLPTLDNLQRALDAARTTHDAAQLIEGVQLVARQLTDVLARHGMKPIEALGKPFDPNLHQAISQVPAPGQLPMTVVTECERGYTMHDRVVRPSAVIVAAPAEAAN